MPIAFARKENGGRFMVVIRLFCPRNLARCCLFNTWTNFLVHLRNFTGNHRDVDLRNTCDSRDTVLPITNDTK